MWRNSEGGRERGSSRVLSRRETRVRSAVSLVMGVPYAATLNSNGTSANFSRVTSLTISTGTFDLANNDLIVDGGSLSAIRGEIQSAYANGTWTGPGLTSSAAAATASSGPNRR